MKMQPFKVEPPNTIDIFILYGLNADEKYRKNSYTKNKNERKITSKLSVLKFFNEITVKIFIFLLKKERNVPYIRRLH